MAIYIEYDGLTKYFVTDENFQPNYNTEINAKIIIRPTQISNEEKYKYGNNLSSDFTLSLIFGNPAFLTPNSDMVQTELLLKSGFFIQNNPLICVFGTPVQDNIKFPKLRFATPTFCFSVLVEFFQFCSALLKSGSPIFLFLPNYYFFVEDGDPVHLF